MTTRHALVVSADGTPTRELDDALADAGFAAVHHTDRDLLDHPDLAAGTELLMVSAALGHDRVALLDAQLGAGGLDPALVIFPSGDYGDLEACARSGFAYVMPPFRSGLLEERIASCRERTKLTSAVAEIASTVRLREYERDLAIARDIQAGFLPDQLPQRSGWCFAARMRPAREVGGDFYDGFELVNGRRLGFLVADVCDKGVGAALFMALIRTLLRHTAEHTGGWSLIDDEPIFERFDEDGSGSPPPVLSVGVAPLLQAVTGTNHYLLSNHREQAYFATLFFGVLDPVSGLLIYINCGHNPPVLVRRTSGHPVLLNPTGPAVGIQQDSSFLLGYVHLSPGDALFIYTDGVVEARDPAGQQFGMSRLCEVVQRPAATAAALIDNVTACLDEFVGLADQFDDITMFALRRDDER